MSEAEASQVIDSILKHDSIGPVLTKEYNEAYRYLNSAGVHLSQAVIGTDALLAGPGRISQLMRLSLAAGGSYQTGKGIAQVSDGKIAEGGTNIALGSAAIFGGYAGNKVVGKPSGGIVSPEKLLTQESSLVINRQVDALHQLDGFVKSFADSKYKPATAIAAIDPLTGKISTASSGSVPSIIAPELYDYAQKLGGLGVKTTCGNTLGRCAEFRAANDLLLANPNL